MKHSLQRVLLTVLLGITPIFSNIYSQQVHSFYFLDNTVCTNTLNPAIQPSYNFYFGTPVAGLTQTGIENNSITLKDLVYTKNKQLISFLHPDGSTDKLMNVLKESTNFQQFFQTDIFRAGFRMHKGYWHFNFSLKEEANISIPKDLVYLSLYGTPEISGNTFNFNYADINANTYFETGIGYSYAPNKIWKVGGKVKFLWGILNTSMDNKNMSLYAGVDKWEFNVKNTLNVAIPGKLVIEDQWKGIRYTKPNSLYELLGHPNGLGGAIDVGATYTPVKHLNLSASITDFGFIHWYNGIHNIDFPSYTYKGIILSQLITKKDLRPLMDSIIHSVKTTYQVPSTQHHYQTATTAQLHIAAEYGLFFQDRISIGLLSSTTVRNNYLFEKVITSLNFKPKSWFNFAGSYTLVNGRGDSFGFGLGLHTGLVQLMIASDYIPLSYASFVNNGKTNIVPYNSQGLNIALSMNIVFNHLSNIDKNGIHWNRKMYKSKCNCP